MFCGWAGMAAAESGVQASSTLKTHQGQITSGDRTIAYTFTYDQQGREIINVGGISIRSNFYASLDNPEAGWATGYLSPDETRLIFRIQASHNHNLWVLNLKRKTVEFVSKDNPTRHLCIEWLDSSRFQLMVADMGYATMYTYQQVDGKRQLTREVDWPLEAFK
jgi:hypothetical protein